MFSQGCLSISDDVHGLSNTNHGVSANGFQFPRSMLDDLFALPELIQMSEYLCSAELISIDDISAIHKPMSMREYLSKPVYMSNVLPSE